MKFNSSIFNEIKNSVSNKNESAFKDVLKFEAGKQYLLRIVPNIPEGRKTIFHYYHHSWNSLSTNKFVTALCPTTFGEQCPICSHAIKTYRNGTPQDREKNKLISRKENWLANVYVVKDPSTPENEGKVKILRYGKELAGIINAAIDGDDASEFGAKIFDIQNGCSLRIKCEARGNAPQSKQFVTYSQSKFVSPSTLDDVDDEVLENIYKGMFKLEEMYKLPSSPDLVRLLDQHYFCTEDHITEEPQEDSEEVSSKPALKTVKAKKSSDKEEDSFFEGVSEAKDVKSSKSDDEDDDEFYDDELRDILNKI